MHPIQLFGLETSPKRPQLSATAGSNQPDKVYKALCHLVATCAAPGLAKIALLENVMGFRTCLAEVGEFLIQNLPEQLDQ